MQFRDVFVRIFLWQDIGIVIVVIIVWNCEKKEVDITLTHMNMMFVSDFICKFDKCRTI